MLSDIMTGLPPIIHSTTATSNDAAAVIVGLLIAFVLLATIILAMSARRSAQEQEHSQMKEARQRIETPLQPLWDQQPQVHTPEEEKVLLPR